MNIKYIAHLIGRSLLLLILVFTYNFSAAQSRTISGIVVDSITAEPLPFVHIMAAGGTYAGSISDIDGKFKITIDRACEELVFSFVGYKSLHFSLKGLTKSTDLKIALSPAAINFEELVILAGENPAYRIIRHTTANRKQHNPERLKAFRYQSYNKALLFNEQNKPKETLSFETNDEILADSLAASDSLPKNKLPFYFFMMESVTERNFIFPDKDQETVLGTRVSGFQHPSFAPLTTAMQPFSFYQDLIFILDKEYINPISPGSINRYEFRLEDTLFSKRGEHTETDSIFVISFFPRKGKNFDALKGILYINSHGYAVQYVLAEPANKGLMDLKFEQKYEWVADTQWFPVQLNFELKLNPYNEGWFTLQGKSYLNNIEVRPQDLRKRDIGLNSVDMLKDASKRPEDFWEKYRNQPLTEKELNTYRLIDSLGKAFNMDGLLSFSQELPNGMLPIGPLSVDISKLMNYNPFEKFRLGLGLYTGTKISKRIIFGGYFGYGFGDKRWKYGGDFIAHIAPKKDFSLELIYRNEVAEPAPLFDRTGLLSTFVTPNETFARRYVLTRMDYQQRLELGLHFRLFRYMQIHPFINATEISPGYDYYFLNNDGVNVDRFRLVQVGAQIRWTYKEKYADFNGRRTKVESRWPALYLSYIQGLKLPTWGNIEYKKLTVGLEANFFIKGLGRTQLDIQSGWIDRAVPFSLLFNGRGSRNGYFGLFNRSTFQTMDLTEFYSDRFVYGFLVHNFGPLPFKSKKFRPEPKIIQGVGFGTLSAPSRHRLVDFKTMEKGYFESGIMFDNLLKMNMSNMAYLGLGVGAFYRYGAYHLPKGIDNWAFKIGLSLSL